MTILTTAGTVTPCLVMFDGAPREAWFLFPGQGRERRCLGLVARMSPDEAVFAATGIKPIRL